MKTKTLLATSFLLSILLMNCENPIHMKTVVREDGSLDKTIVLEKADSLTTYYNVFGVSEAEGWKITSEKLKREEDKTQFKLTFEKSYPSVEAVNMDLDQESDTLFRIHAAFEKKFRWFYTYMRYSETFRPIDRLKMVKANDYFNAEDRSFINRLPGEGAVISKADSLYLQLLNEKIYDHYANMGLFNEQFDIIREVVKRNTTEKKWLDTLDKNKDFIFRKLDDMEGDPLFASKMADSLGIPLPKEKAIVDFNLLSKDLNSRIGFMGYARDGKYQNSIEMPWPVITSNADSVAGNKLFWKPLATKFAIQEYEMFGESRKLNWWAVGLSALIFVLTFFLFLKRQPKI
jgi:hypothetical protein